jgi:excisionase family DNA binding protein
MRISPGTTNLEEELMSTKLTYTVTEAAELLGISRSSAYECVRRGEIPSLTLGRRVVIPRRALEALLAVEPERPEPVRSKGVR